jgi:hypothetical protein
MYEYSYLRTLALPGYASDPDVFSGADGNYYIDYANGDFSNCGGISVAPMTPGNMQSVGTAQQLQINGIGVLGNCGGTGRPYLEGPQIYVTGGWGLTGVPGPYLMVVAAKPDHVPTECQNYLQPNTANEVLAYATGSSPMGPFTYQGILMCGSSTEWTDQGSLSVLPDVDGRQRLVLYYHDGPSGEPNRKVHAECLMYGNGHLALANRSQTWLNLGFNSPTFQSCMQDPGGVDESSVALRSESTGLFVTADLNSGANLYANRYGPGPWELFDAAVSGSSVSLQAHANGEWVAAASSGNHALTASSPSQTGTGTSFRLKLPWVLGGKNAYISAPTGTAVVTGTGSQLFANGSPLGPTYFDSLHY